VCGSAVGYGLIPKCVFQAIGFADSLDLSLRRRQV